MSLKKTNDWREYCKLNKVPSDIPKEPHLRYRNRGWRSWGDWLGTGAIANRLRKYRSFDDTRKFVRSLGLESQSDWVRFSKSDKMPRDIPVGAYNLGAGLTQIAGRAAKIAGRNIAGVATDIVGSASRDSTTN